MSQRRNMNFFAVEPSITRTSRETEVVHQQYIFDSSQGHKLTLSVVNGNITDRSKRNFCELIKELLEDCVGDKKNSILADIKLIEGKNPLSHHVIENLNLLFDVAVGLNADHQQHSTINLRSKI